jgi:hypothetical protein
MFLLAISRQKKPAILIAGFFCNVPSGDQRFTQWHWRVL